MRDLTPDPSPGRGGERLRQPGWDGGQKRYIVRGQQVDGVKADRARVLRGRMTEAERILWDRLRDGRAAGWRFRRQQVIDGFIADFYCHAAGLVVEVDGAIHDSQREYDQERDHVLRSRGLQLLRVPNDAIRTDLTRILQRIVRACAEAAAKD